MRAHTHTAESGPTPNANTPLCHIYTRVLAHCMWNAFQTHHFQHNHAPAAMYICTHANMCAQFQSLNFNGDHLSSGSPFHCASWCCHPSLLSLCTSSLLPFLTSPPCLCYVCNQPSFNTCIPTAWRNVFTM